MFRLLWMALSSLCFFLSVNSIYRKANHGHKDIGYEHQIDNPIIDGFCFCRISFTFQSSTTHGTLRIGRKGKEARNKKQENSFNDKS